MDSLGDCCKLERNRQVHSLSRLRVKHICARDGISSKQTSRIQKPFGLLGNKQKEGREDGNAWALKCCAAAWIFAMASLLVLQQLTIGCVSSKIPARVSFSRWMTTE
jgi:hypothetical protein